MFGKAKAKGAGGAPSASISGTDLAVALVGLPVLTAAAWTVPERGWRYLSRAAAPLALRGVTADPGATIGRMRRLLGRYLADRGPDAILCELAAALVERQIQYMALGPPGFWRPAVRLEGRGNIEAALGRGRGVVLWNSHFAFDSLLTKIGLHGAGFAVSHLSHPRHGFSATRFGVRVLNRLPVAIEDRYLRERVLLPFEGSAAGAIEILRGRLRQNGVVSITVRPTARRPVEVSFFDGALRLAVGAPNLAYDTGAALLPVFTVREETGAFNVIVEPPLDLPAARPRHAASERAARAYAERLQRHVLRCPGQWLGWADL